MRQHPFELVVGAVQEQTTTGRDSRQLAPKQRQEPNWQPKKKLEYQSSWALICPQVVGSGYDTYTSVNSVSAMILYTILYRSISDVEVSQSQIQMCVKREAFHSGQAVWEYSHTNPIHYKQKPPPAQNRKSCNAQRGAKMPASIPGKFTAWLLGGFFFFSGDGDGSTTTVAGRTGGRPMGWRRGQLSWRYWRILMMLQRTTTTRRAAMVGCEEGRLSLSMPSWEHLLCHPLASC